MTTDAPDQLTDVETPFNEAVLAESLAEITEEEITAEEITEESEDANEQAPPKLRSRGRVAIVGRPNVGKSTLVNRIIGARMAIVDDQPGVTRDRSYHEVEWCAEGFTLIDTGGLVPDSEDPFGTLINDQVAIAVSEADVVVFLVDGQAGLTPLDETIAEQIRQAQKPTLLAVNKIDSHKDRFLINEFYAIGLGDPYPLSAMHGSGGVGDLLDAVLKALPEAPAHGTETLNPIRLAIVGKPNVGKSSILNRMVGENRTIVSEIAGTTRDAIDVTVTYEGKPYVLVDTAGIRRKNKVDYGVELFSVDRAIRAIRNADVAVLVVDATIGITDQDKRIIQTCQETGKGLVMVMNKWDLVENKSTKIIDETKKKLYQELPFAQYVNILFTSAETGQRLVKIYQEAELAYQNNHRHIKTSLLNQVFIEATTLSQPPLIKNKRLKVLYATQVGEAPPTFVLFVNDAKLMKESYQRYLEKKLRAAFDFTGSPLRFILRSRGDKA